MAMADPNYLERKCDYCGVPPGQECVVRGTDRRAEMTHDVRLYPALYPRGSKT